MDWFCILQGEQHGPLAIEALIAWIRQGKLKPDDHVWTEAFGDSWRQVRDVPELNPPVLSAPVQHPARATDAQPVYKTPLTGVPGNRPHFRVAVQEAWDRMVLLLFKPGDPVRWLSIGFCAWIAIFSLMGGGVDLPTPKSAMTRFQQSPSMESLRAMYQQGYDQALTQLHATGLPLPLLLTGLVILMIAWALLSSWVRARGAFMLLHRWHQPDATIAQSWAVSRGLGRSLFLFRLLFNLAMLALLALIGVGAAFSVVLPLVAGVPWSDHMLLWMAVWLTVLLLHISLWGTAVLLLDEWVTPVMYWRRVGALAAWRTVLNLCNEQPTGVVIYLTLYPFVWLAAMLAVLAVCICTCCIACIGLFLPYVNALLLLPVLLFLRGLGISFMRQWRPDLPGL